uniref:Uncharacterized protein n=1 Tax=Panagrolaimus sp. PS1159 TaxID=55785 RepID=A0AC35FIC7_9BILA
MSLLLFFLFGVLITIGEADKCCKFYVPPPSTVLVQLKNHNIIGAVPRQSPPSHYSSHLLPPQISTNYQENVRDLNNAENKKQQPAKTSSTSFTPTTSNSQTLFPQAILLPNGTLSRNNTGVETQQQGSKNSNIAQKISTTPSRSSFSNTQSLLQTTTTAVKTNRTQNSQKSVKTTPTISVSEVTHENYNTNQQPNISSKAIPSSSTTKTTASEPTSTLVTTTVFIPGHRDAQKYGNNPYEENSVQNFKAINVILLLPVIANILANVR